MELYFLIGFLGLFCGLVSGLIGIGGGIIMAPLLLFVPPLLGFPPLSMHTVAGLTIVQGLAACISGAIVHNKFKFVSRELSTCMGISIFIAAIAGGAGARYVDNHILLIIFGLIALTAAVLMTIGQGGDQKTPAVEHIKFSYLRAAVTAGGVGLIGGLVGQGGSFILIPLMISYVKIPTRIAIGSNLAIVLLSTTAAFIGKALTGQIEWLLTIPIILTVIPATAICSHLSHRVPVAKLRIILATIIALAAVRIWVSILLT